ncbi:U4/U6-U5 snRNP complex subunit PRP3 [Kluyveromyces lactis]|uniref:KLLA0E09285p n=1 Tax=Kluyveromyces lactis (strain ATCC 8585 / CBS 2359 / DSM 70799 / NBRC 1267 / NRRL Y-1140 / WM37) TaxID=284590 RepID=Q6CNX1_KLULA|nr:uncharacterized protein KLLA0_E09285g [Kluyveromyces lactis]CAG99455.1 KLLA0E09285p [Kluyveromyces lactis]|eukprot:XP_454368.1 uncharacterized protein KLLA0_E09285g [Kluyveromyces lactis]
MGNDNNTNRGLNRKLHSALSVENVNLLRFQGRRCGNPYLQDVQAHGFEPKARVSSHWYEPGEVVQHAAKLRQENREKSEEERIRWEAELEKQQEIERKIEIGELPDKHEEVYFTDLSDVPDVEWWDVPYIKDGSIHEKYSLDYSTLNSDDESDDEEEEEEEGAQDKFPSIRYIQHPVPIERPRAAVPVAEIFLTKNERKKARRNTRKLVRQEKEEKIKLGIEPKPEPKVKLSNMMNVYENDANIADPTQWESIVRRQVAERKRKHFEENEIRHQESLKRRKESQLQAHSNDSPLEYTCVVYMFDEIQNPSIRYKIKTNGKQLKLKGCCLHIQNGKGIIVAFGDEKSIRFFDKLVTKRINWSEPYKDRDTEETVPCDGKITKVWQGLIGDCRFKGWFMLDCKDKNQLNNILEQHDALTFVPLGKF